MKIQSMDRETSSMYENVILGYHGDVIHGWRNVIRGCHPWMKVSSLDVIQGWLFHLRMTDIDGAEDVCYTL